LRADSISLCRPEATGAGPAYDSPHDFRDRGSALEENAMTLGTILLIVLILLLVGALPSWGYSRAWGYGPSGGLGLIVVILVVLLLLGRI
jgi:hypothetical protein